MKIYILLILLSILGGCAMSSQMYLADGSIGYNISCDGSALSFAQCYKKAGDICGAKGYVLLDKDGESHGFGYSQGTANANSLSANGQYTTQTGVFVSRNIYIKCKD